MTKSTRRFVAFFALLALVQVVGNHPVVAADFDKSSDREPTDRSVKATTAKTKRSVRVNASAVDQETERNVLQMVDAHLPEIKVLLDRLRKDEPKQYSVAIRNLSRSSRRLQLAKKRGEETFELEVQLVQAQSAINLLIAKLKVRDNPKDRKALRDATKKLQSAEQARAAYDVAQLEDRLKKLNKQLEAARNRLREKEAKSEEQIDQAYRSYLRKSGRK